MKYIKFIIVALVSISFLYYFGVYNRQKQIPAENSPSEQPKATEQGQWETKNDEQPPVSVKITPIELGQNAKTWKFDIAFTTHSGDLNDNLVKAVTLTDDKGDNYQPTAWDGPGPGGHHRKGMLVFNPIQPLPAYVELKIKNVGGIAERSFKWNVK